MPEWSSLSDARSSNPLVLAVMRRIWPLRLRSSIASRLSSRLGESFHGLPNRTGLCLVSGVEMRVAGSDAAHRHLILTGFLELELSRRMLRLGKAGGYLIDVGANVGYFSPLWLASNPRNRVLALEAAPVPMNLLRENLERNSVDRRAVVDGRAAWSRSGRMAFDPGPLEQASWGGLAPAGGGRSFEVEVVRLDEAVLPSLTIAVLKIDVEGADAWVLEGAESLLASGRVGVVFFEQNVERMRALGIAPDAPIDLLARHGYRVRPLRGTRRTEWMATRNERDRRQ